jgi:hypothetical protein
MDRSTARRSRRILLAGTAILVAALSIAALQGTFASGTPSRSWAGTGRAAVAPSALDGDDGVIPEGAAVSVFDDGTPSVSRLDPELLAALREAATDAGAAGVDLRVNSGWRSPEYQQQLLLHAVLEHG